MPTLFGWCLPDMVESVHTQCIHKFSYGTDVVCQCLCHTDSVAFAKEMKKRNTPVITKAVKPRTKKEKTK